MWSPSGPQVRLQAKDTWCNIFSAVGHIGCHYTYSSVLSVQGQQHSRAQASSTPGRKQQTRCVKVLQLVKKFLVLYTTTRFIYVFLRICYCTVYRANLLQFAVLRSSSSRCILILSCHTRQVSPNSVIS